MHNASLTHTVQTYDTWCTLYTFDRLRTVYTYMAQKWSTKKCDTQTSKLLSAEARSGVSRTDEDPINCNRPCLIVIGCHRHRRHHCHRHHRHHYRHRHHRHRHRHCNRHHHLHQQLQRFRVTIVTLWRWEECKLNKYVPGQVVVYGPAIQRPSVCFKGPAWLYGEH